MQTINAANQLQIQADEFTWRLFYMPSGAIPDDSLVTIDAQGVRYQSAFARARRLPAAGLALDQIEMVIVGWEDGQWQLGILLTGTLAADRGGRWCGLARWLDSDGAGGTYNARTAGQLLAGVSGKPYQFVPAPAVADDDEVSAQPPIVPTSAVEAEPPVQPIYYPKLSGVSESPLPIAMGEWALAETRQGVRWEHSPAWRRMSMFRVALFGGLTIAFALLAFGGLRSSFATVQPGWLPYLGVVVAIIMAVLTIGRLFALSAADYVEFDRRNRMIRIAKRPLGVVRQVPFEKIDYLLLSMLTLRRQPTHKIENGIEENLSVETWLHAMRQKGDFLEIGHVAQADGRASRPSVGSMGGGTARRALDIEETDTPVHQAALILSRIIEAPVYVEERH